MHQHVLCLPTHRGAGRERVARLSPVISGWTAEPNDAFQRKSAARQAPMKETKAWSAQRAYSRIGVNTVHFKCAHFPRGEGGGGGWILMPGCEIYFPIPVFFFLSLVFFWFLCTKSFIHSLSFIHLFILFFVIWSFFACLMHLFMYIYIYN